ncbi:MAG: aminomethyl-transferring glycine dehydrogenase subunit GcvPA [Calditrichia bacterium]
MAYIPISKEEQQEMLNFIGVNHFNDLLEAIPEELITKEDLNIPESLSENELMKHVMELASKNTAATSFAGGGAYDHFIPAAISHILQRSEFYTAYTPYQAEVSQGTLQAIYEFQTMIGKLTKMDVVNASMYDGGTSLAEAILMANGISGKNKVIISDTLNPRYVSIIESYISDNEIELEIIPSKEGKYDLATLEKALTDDTAAVVLQQPNFFGVIEDAFQISDMVKSKNILLIASIDPASLSVIAPPGDYGADIVVGEGQSLGIPLNFGGPYLGLFAAKKEFIRKMPGRIIGRTEDMDGNRGFVMVLQTREQHIRREKATSNICTNSGLMALAATVYLALLGETGFKQMGQITLSNSHYLANEITKLNGYRLKFNQPFFKEFVVETPVPASDLIQKLSAKGILAGIDISRYKVGTGLLVSVTEKRTKEEMDYFVQCLKEL